VKSQHVTNGPKSFLKMTNSLRDMRIEKKKTQDAIAEELGMPRGSYALIEAGTALPNETLLENLIHVFRCSKPDLYSSVYLNIIDAESND